MTFPAPPVDIGTFYTGDDATNLASFLGEEFDEKGIRYRVVKMAAAKDVGRAGAFLGYGSTANTVTINAANGPAAGCVPTMDNSVYTFAISGVFAIQVKGCVTAALVSTSLSANVRLGINTLCELAAVVVSDNLDAGQVFLLAASDCVETGTAYINL